MVNFSGLCLPAQVYVVLTALSLVGLIFGKQYGAAVGKLIFGIIFTFFLNFLCDKGFPGVSWFFVLIPFIIFGLFFLVFFFGVTTTVAKANTKAAMQHPQQQHPQQQQQMQQQHHEGFYSY